MQGSYLGPSYTNKEVKEFLDLNSISFKYLENDKLNEEEYILKINTDQINIEASTETGAIFGFQSLQGLYSGRNLI